LRFEPPLAASGLRSWVVEIAAGVAAHALAKAEPGSRAVSIVAMYHRFALRLTVNTYENSLRYP
jgi:hypothetical protein